MEYKNTIIDSKDLVLGEIYMITNKTTGKRYIGQTLTHRLNHKRYRPYGFHKRFLSHMSEALCDTKKHQCTCLANAIRQFGKDDFEVELLMTCNISDLDAEEIRLISIHDTIHPNGFNLARGGNFKTAETSEPYEIVSAPIGPPRSFARSQATKEKIKTSLAAYRHENPEDYGRHFRTIKYARNAKKLASFKGVHVDSDIMETYITTSTCQNGFKTIVRIGDKITSFHSKFDTEEESRNRALQFIHAVVDDNSNIATLPN